MVGYPCRLLHYTLANPATACEKRIGAKYPEIDSIPLLPKGNPEECRWLFLGYDNEDSEHPNGYAQKLGIAWWETGCA